MELLKDKQHEFCGITFIERSRDLKHGVKKFVHLSEIDHPNSLVVNGNTGYYVVKEEESVIFYSFSDAAHGNVFSSSNNSANRFLETITIELAIIHGVALNASFSPLLFYWLAGIVKQACSERRNVRVSIHLYMIFKYLTDIIFKPNHPGQLVQVGLNMGPHHAHVLGWAKSYTKKFDGQVMVEHDIDAVGALSIMWSLVQSIMPCEILMPLIHV
jgi:hypothetical protein